MSEYVKQELLPEEIRSDILNKVMMLKSWFSENMDVQLTWFEYNYISEALIKWADEIIFVNEENYKSFYKYFIQIDNAKRSSIVIYVDLIDYFAHSSSTSSLTLVSISLLRGFFKNTTTSLIDLPIGVPVFM